MVDRQPTGHIPPQIATQRLHRLARRTGPGHLRQHRRTACHQAAAAQHRHRSSTGVGGGGCAGPGRTPAASAGAGRLGRRQPRGAGLASRAAAHIRAEVDARSRSNPTLVCSLNTGAAANVGTINECPRPVDTPHRPFTAPLVARDLPVDGQIPPVRLRTAAVRLARARSAAPIRLYGWIPSARSTVANATGSPRSTAFRLVSSDLSSWR